MEGTIQRDDDGGTHLVFTGRKGLVRLRLSHSDWDLEAFSDGASVAFERRNGKPVVIGTQKIRPTDNPIGGGPPRTLKAGLGTRHRGQAHRHVDPQTQLAREISAAAARRSLDISEYAQIVNDLLLRASAPTAANVAAVMSSLSGRTGNPNPAAVGGVLLRCASVLRACPMSGREIGRALHALNGMEDDVVPASLLDILAHKVRALPRDGPRAIDGESIGTGLYGLRSLTALTVPAALLEAMTPAIAELPATGRRSFDGRAIASSLYGINNLSCEVVSMPFLSAIGSKIVSAPDEGRRALTDRHVGNALYGLKNLGDAVVPRSLLETFATRLVTGRPQRGEVVEGRHMCNAMYGLRNLTALTVPRTLLDAIAQKVNALPMRGHRAMRGRHLGMALLGIRNLDRDTIPDSLLDAFGSKLPGIDDLQPRNVADALQGLVSSRCTDERAHQLTTPLKEMVHVAGFLDDPIASRRLAAVFDAAGWRRPSTISAHGG